ncbi:MAG: hypothetical protein R2745_00415 [Vicinamibacterales bacterium]
MMRLWPAVLLLLAASALPGGAQSTNKVPIVAVTGCLAEQGGAWTLTAATDPTPSIANGPPAGEAVKGPTSGKNAYRLIGVSEFDLPAHKGHTVLVKGLFIKATPLSRVNVTSVTMVSTACAPAPK